MNLQSKLLLIIGVFVLRATCSGQRPSCEKPVMHFAADIIKVDSILSTSFYSDKQRDSNIRLRDVRSGNDSIHFELIRDKGKRKKSSIYPKIAEMGGTKKI